jgi:hypothetical protein
MLSLQVVPRAGVDAYRLLRDKVAHGAQTWSWKNKAKTRLIHKRNGAGYIEVGNADGVVVAEIHATHETDTYFFAEKFIGRLVAWFLPDLAAINVQFHDTDGPAAGRKGKKTKSRR